MVYPPSWVQRVFVILGGAYIYPFRGEGWVYLFPGDGFLFWIYRPYIGGYIKGSKGKDNAKNINTLMRYISDIFIIYGRNKDKGNNKRSGANK